MSSFGKIIRNIKKYDVIEIHFLDPFYSDFYIDIREKSERLNICVWGSDFYRVNDNDKLNQSKLIKVADYIILGNPRTALEFKNEFNLTENKIRICQFGLSILDNINDINEEDIEKFYLKYNIQKEKTIITIGHNGFNSQQHESILAKLKELTYIEKEKLYIIIPMTYGCTIDYINYINKIAIENKFEFTIINEYLSEKEVAILRKITDIFIQMQVTDQLSGSMQEHLYAGNIVITGDWLPYEIFDEIGIFMIKTNLQENLLVSKIRESISGNFSLYLKNNKNLIYEYSSWRKISKIWYDIYVGENSEYRNLSERIKKEIISLIELNKLDLAIRIFEEYKKSVKLDSDYYSFSGYIHILLEEYDEAYLCFKEGILKFRYNYDLWQNLAYVNFIMSKEKEGFVALINAYCLSKNEEDIQSLESLIEKFYPKFYQELPEITVGVISYNSEKYIENCINSIMGQTYPKIKIIIIDDDSKDGTKKIVETLKSKYKNIEFHYHEKNTGCQSRAIREIIEFSKTKYLSIISYDDAYFSEHSMLEFISKMEINTELDFIYSDMAISSDGFVITDFWGTDKLNKNTILNHVSKTGSGLIPMGMGVFKSNFLKKLKPTYIIPNLIESKGNTGADTLNILYYINNGMNYDNINKPLMMYRIHENNVSYSLESRIKSNYYVQKYLISNFDGLEQTIRVERDNLLEEEDKKNFYAAKHFFYYIEEYIYGEIIPNYIKAKHSKEEILMFCKEFTNEVRRKLESIKIKTEEVKNFERYVDNFFNKKGFLNLKSKKEKLSIDDNFEYVGISFYGRSGSVFLQSLLDSHPEIVMLPGLYLMDYGKFWNFVQSNCSNSDELIKYFNEWYRYLFDPNWRNLNNVNSPWLDIIYHSGYNRMGENENETIYVDKYEFNLELREQLECLEEIERKDFFKAIQVSYFNTLKRKYNPNTVYKIVYPLHSSLVVESHHLWFLDDFKDAKILYTLRDPVENINSILKYYSKNQLLDENILMNVFYYLGIMTGPTIIETKFKISNLRGVKLEELHTNSKKTLILLCEFLNLSWHENLMKSTFNGLLWWNFRDSVKFNGFNNNIIQSSDYEYLDEFDRLRIKMLLNNIYIKFEYGESRVLYKEDLKKIFKYPFKFEENIVVSRRNFDEYIEGYIESIEKNIVNNFKLLK